MYDNNSELIDRKNQCYDSGPSQIIKRVLKMTNGNVIAANAGTELNVYIDTVCFYADTPNVNESFAKTIQLLRIMN